MQPNENGRYRKLLLWALLPLAACSGGATGTGATTGTTGGSTSSAQEVSVAVTPGDVALAPGAQQGFAAAVTGSADGAVAWAVQEGSAGGTVTADGIYTAPSGLGVFHVVATSHADPSKSASASVTVTSAPAPVAVTVTPGTTSVYGCQSVALSAAVTGSANGAVTWAVQEGAAGGTVTTSGVYTAPVAPGSYHVVATSAADPSRKASATLTVTTKVLRVAVNPVSLSVQAGGTAQLTATVTTTCGDFQST